MDTPNTPNVSPESFEAYVLLFNSLDDLIWRIPGYLGTGAAIVIGFAGTILANKDLDQVPPVIIAVMFLFVGLLFGLCAYSLYRIRVHHKWVGEDLARMEIGTYFKQRLQYLEESRQPTAQSAFVVTFGALSLAFIALACIALIRFQWLQAAFAWRS